LRDPWRGEFMLQIDDDREAALQRALATLLVLHAAFVHCTAELLERKIKRKGRKYRDPAGRIAATISQIRHNVEALVRQNDPRTMEELKGLVSEVTRMPLRELAKGTPAGRRPAVRPVLASRVYRSYLDKLKESVPSEHWKRLSSVEAPPPPAGH